MGSVYLYVKKNMQIFSKFWVWKISAHSGIHPDSLLAVSSSLVDKSSHEFRKKITAMFNSQKQKNNWEDFHPIFTRTSFFFRVGGWGFLTEPLACRLTACWSHLPSSQHQVPSQLSMKIEIIPAEEKTSSFLFSQINAFSGATLSWRSEKPCERDLIKTRYFKNLKKMKIWLTESIYAYIYILIFTYAFKQIYVCLYDTYIIILDIQYTVPKKISTIFANIFWSKGTKCICIYIYVYIYTHVYIHVFRSQ